MGSVCSHLPCGKSVCRGGARGSAREAHAGARVRKCPGKRMRKCRWRRAHAEAERSQKRGTQRSSAFPRAGRGASLVSWVSWRKILRGSLAGIVLCVWGFDLKEGSRLTASVCWQSVSQGEAISVRPTCATGPAPGTSLCPAGPALPAHWPGRGPPPARGTGYEA